MKYIINEIFRSIQGEGCCAGMSTVFIRFSGCNLKCEWCDTDHKTGRSMFDVDIAREATARSTPGDLLVLTGGEPLLQLDTLLLIHLRHKFRFISIETNGTKHVPSIWKKDDYLNFWITVSPKDPKTVFSLPAIYRADELKIVVPGKWTENDLCEIERRFPQKVWLYVQPEYENEGATEWAINHVMKHPRWRLSLQTQKILGIP